MTPSKADLVCGTITNVNTESLRVSDQTYTVRCNDWAGVAVTLERQRGAKTMYWTIAEVVVQYHRQGNL